MASRILGFIRDILMATALGAGPITDAFVIAFRLPNMFRRLVAEGAFSAAFIPLFSRELKENPKEVALEFAAHALGFLTGFLFLFSALFMIFMPFLMQYLAPGFEIGGERFERAVMYTRITFPYLTAMAIVALLGGVLNALYKFAAMSAALGSPFDVTGAAHLPVGIDGAPCTMIRIEGFAQSVAYRAEELCKTLLPFGKAAVQHGDTDDGYGTSKGWAYVRDVAAFADQSGDVWRISVKPSHAAVLVSQIGANAVQYDWGGGLIWALVPEGSNVRDALGDFQGHATLIRASEDTRAAITPFQPEPAPLAALSTNLRAKFDPRGILNSGLMT